MDGWKALGANWTYYFVVDASGMRRFESLVKIEVEIFARSMITRGEHRPEIYEVDRF
jgi:hypothetical protein